MGDSYRNELYNDLDSYISKRRELDPVPIRRPKPKPKKGLFSRMFSRRSVEPEFTPQHQPVFEVGDHEPVTERVSLLQRLARVFIREQQVLEEMQELPEAPVDEAREDLKELARVFLKTLERLPDKDLQNFKSTAEFFQFKAILSKHSLIKSPDTPEPAEEIVQ